MSEELITVSPMSRQFIMRSLAGFIERSDGEDIHLLIKTINILINEMKLKNSKFKLGDKKLKTLKLCDRLTQNIIAYKDDDLIDKKDIEHPKFLAYRDALSNIPLVEFEIYEIFYDLISKTNLIHITIPHDYLVEERKGQREIKLEENSSESLQGGKQFE